MPTPVIIENSHPFPSNPEYAVPERIFTDFGCESHALPIEYFVFENYANNAFLMIDTGALMIMEGFLVRNAHSLDR